MAFTNMTARAAGYIIKAASDWNVIVNNFAALWVGTGNGDMDYYSSATEKTRIAAGTNGLVLTMTSGVPAWQSGAIAAYPVGSIHISTVSTNPATTLGFGTWAAFGAGRVLVGIDATDTDFDTVEETGGEKAHALTSAENGAHTHSYTRGNVSQLVSSGDQNAVYYPPSTGTTGSSGSGTAHNNLQPYIVVYMWKRTE